MSSKKAAPLALLLFTFCVPALALASDEFADPDRPFGIEAEAVVPGLMVDHDNNVIDLSPEFGPDDDFIVGSIVIGQAALLADAQSGSAEQASTAGTPEFTGMSIIID